MFTILICIIAIALLPVAIEVVLALGVILLAIPVAVIGGFFSLFEPSVPFVHDPLKDPPRSDKL